MKRPPSDARLVRDAPVRHRQGVDSPRVDWRFAVAATLVLTCLFTLQASGLDGAAPFHLLHRRQGITWGTWMLLTPAIIAVQRRMLVGRGWQPRWWLQQALWAVAFAAAAAAIFAALRAAGGPFRDILGPQTVTSLGSFFAGDLLRYAIIALAYQAFASSGLARARETQAATLRAELAEARLATIEGRLHPHFLFNTLNAIATLVRENPAAAEAMVEQLSEVLRASLTSHPTRQVDLEEELHLTEQYLAIQQARFQDRLTATVEATREAREGRVPQLILQPLVENAIRHGIGPRESGGSIRVSAAVQGDALVMVVEDDGLGMANASPASAGTGLGLSSVRARLTHLYGSNHRFEAASLEPSGTRVVITLPYLAAEG
jgi:histidine kinase/histidine kinase/DNA gyrase B/HSP90-like ATPase